MSSDVTERQFGLYRVSQTLWQRELTSLHLAHHVQQDHPAFLLVLNTTVKEDPVLADRFQRRMETVAQLEHEGIAPIEESGVSNSDHCFAAIRFFEHEMLADKTARLANSGQRMPRLEALALIQQLASALALAHPAGLIHHDLRPAHILLTENNSPVLIDLGIPDRAAQDSAELKETVTEVIDYASPEQLQGKALSGQSNIYSLGVILYELLAGQRPQLPISEWDIFERDEAALPREIPLESVRGGLAPQTYRLVSRCLWRPEWNRFEAIDKMLAAIDAAIEAEQAGLDKKPTKRLPVSQRLIWALLALAALLSIAAAYLLLTS